MDRSNWARRADVLLRANHPHLLTRIFETLPDTFVIVLDPDQQKADDLNVDEIRFITLNLSLSNEIPGVYARELTPIPDSEMVQDFSGFPYTRSELFNLISSKFSHLPIIGMREGKYPDGTNVIEVSTQLLSGQQKTLLDFCDNLGSIVPFSVEVSNNSESAPSAYSDVLEIRSSRARPQLPPFVRADEDFWFDNIDLIANGKLALHRIPGLLDDQSRCFIDATVGSQINLRQALMTFDTIYISPPLADKYSEFLETQALTEEDLLLLIEVGRLKIVSTQPEERVELKFLSAAFERSQTAFVGRRKAAALLLNDIVKTADEYWWSQPQNVLALAEVCDIVAKEHGSSPLEVQQRMFWPLRARRLALRPLLTRGSKGIIGFGIGHEFGTALKNSTRDIELFCMMLSERIHVAHALNATTFLGWNEHSAFAPLANSMGNFLNTFRSFNTRLAKNWLKNEQRKGDPARLLPPIPLLEFERSLPLKELLTACDDVMLRNHGRSLLSRIAELPESDRAAEITRLSGELRRLGKPKGFMTLDNADTIIAAASILFGFVYPPLAGIRVIGGQVLDRLSHNPMVAKALDRLTSDLFGDHSERDEIDFLSQVSRVAVLKTDRVS